MFGLGRTKTVSPRRPTGPPPARTPEERRRTIAEIAAAEASAAECGSRLAAELAEARRREAEARAILATATAERVRLEGEQLATGGAQGHRIARWRRQLAEGALSEADGAPSELEVLAQDVAALVDHARTRVDTKLQDGYQDLTGRRPQMGATNAGAIQALLLAARAFTAELQAERYAEHPDMARFGPFVEIAIDRGQLMRAGRADESGGLVARRVVVPAALAALYDAIGGVALARPELSPAEAREVVWSAERSAQRRWNSGEAWR